MFRVLYKKCGFNHAVFVPRIRVQILLVQYLFRDQGEAAFLHPGKLGVDDFVVLLDDGVKVLPGEFGDGLSAGEIIFRAEDAKRNRDDEGIG